MKVEIRDYVSLLTMIVLEIVSLNTWSRSIVILVAVNVVLKEKVLMFLKNRNYGLT